MNKQKRLSEDVHKNAIQAFIKYKAQNNIKAIASKLREQDYVHVIQPKADNQRNIIPITDFPWTDPYIAEKTLPLETIWYK